MGGTEIDGAEPHACTRIAEFEPGVQEWSQAIERSEARESCHKDHEHSSCGVRNGERGGQRQWI